MGGQGCRSEGEGPRAPSRRITEDPPQLPRIGEDEGVKPASPNQIRYRFAPSAYPAYLTPATIVKIRNVIASAFPVVATPSPSPSDSPSISPDASPSAPESGAPESASP